MGNNCCRDPEAAVGPESVSSSKNHQIIGVMTDSFKADKGIEQGVNRSSSVLSIDADLAQSISLRTGRPTFYDLIQQEQPNLDGPELNHQATHNTLVQDGEDAPLTFKPRNKSLMRGAEGGAPMTFGKSVLSISEDPENSELRFKRDTSPRSAQKTVATEQVEMEDVGGREQEEKPGIVMDEGFL